MMDSVYLLLFVPLCLGMFQGLLFGTLLIIRAYREERLSDYLLAALLISGCLILLPVLLGALDIHLLWTEWLFLPLDPGLLIGPFVYLFVLAHTNRGFRLSRRTVYHFIPFAIYTVYHLAVFVQGRDFIFQWMDTVDLPYVNPVYQLLTLLSMGIYLVASIRHYRQYLRWIDTEYVNPSTKRYAWITPFLWAITITIAATCVLRVVETFNYDFDQLQAWFSSFMVAVCMYYISIAGYMSARPPLTNSLNLVTDQNHSETGPSQQEIDQLLSTLTDWMQSNKAHLDPELSLGTVASALGVSREVISAVINKGYGKNFRSFVNDYRVSAFKEAVLAGKSEEFTLFGLALECGFNSKATFNRVFKQIEGITPNAFARQAKAALAE